MLRYLVHRLLIMIPTLIAISAIVFVIIQLPPGDYLTTYITELQAQGEAVSEDKVAFLRKQYGLGLPWYEQYFMWLGGLLSGNFGFSFEHNEPVVKVVGDVVWLSMIVASTTIVFSWIVAFPIGVYSATRQYSWGDYTLSFLGFLGLATPSFLLALVLMYFANVWLGISIGGLMDERYIGQPWTWAKVHSILEHLWVPVLVIGAANTAGMIRRLRANLLDELQKQYVVTGRAKGLPPRRLLLKYPLRVALNPFVADIGNILPQIVSSAAVVAVVMSLPTTGPLLIRALRSQDMYLAGFLLMCLATLTVIGVLLSDIALALLDPRIRLQGGIRR
jgi:peptide/nickel transport system permease protein